jgi:hypothetical protein
MRSSNRSHALRGVAFVAALVLALPVFAGGGYGSNPHPHGGGPRGGFGGHQGGHWNHGNHGGGHWQGGGQRPHFAQHQGGSVGARPIYSPPLSTYPPPRLGWGGSQHVAPPVYVPPRVIVAPAPIYYPPRQVIVPQPIYMQPPVVQAPVINYYCVDFQAFFPDVQNCPTHWLRVLPDGTILQ